MHNIHDLTISMWIYLERNHDNACFMSLLDQNDYAIGFFCFKNFRFIIGEYLDSADRPSTGVWFHYMAVRNTLEQTINIYRDGD